MTQYEPVFWDIETTGLNPMAQHFWDGGTNDVIVIAFGHIEGWRGDADEVEYHLHEVHGDSEYELFEEFREEMHSYLPTVEGWNVNGQRPGQGDVNPEAFFVGFNSRHFDHPFYNAKCEGRLRQSSWPVGHHRKRLDMYRVMTKRLGYGYSMSQDDLAEDMGLELAEDSITGKDVPKLYANGEIDTIVNHGVADLKDLMKIFMQVREEAMEEFYEHYGIDADTNYGGGVDL